MLLLSLRGCNIFNIMRSHHPSHPFLFLLLLVAACGLFAPDSFAASVGTVTNLSGDTSILTADGKLRTPSKGALVYQGETAITGKDGKMEIRFSDESIFQLRSQSQFRVDEYSYVGKKDSSAKGFFSLLKGGLRNITGLIGKLNRPGFRVSTATATIGIRGTEYSALLKDGLHVTVERGEISLTNRAGSFAVSEGQSAFVPDQDAAPRYLQSSGTPQSSVTQTGITGKTQIRGNTRIDASTSNTDATAAGQGNTSTNKAGVIGSD